MQAFAALLVVAVLNASGAWGGGLTFGATQRLLPSDVELLHPSDPAPDTRVNVANHSDEAPTPIPPSVRPYDAVGRIEDARRTRSGTGFLIGPCTVLTAYHVLFPAGETPSRKAKFRFAVGHGGHTEFSSVAQASPIYWGDFSYSENTPTEDFAVLNVPSCPGRKFQPIELAPMLLSEIEESGGKLRNAGYPIGRSKGRVWGDEDCMVGGMHPLDPELFAINCYGVPGMSGGPVLAEKDGHLMAIAIMSRAATGGPISAGPHSTMTAPPDLMRYNLALPVSEFLARLSDLGLVGR